MICRVEECQEQVIRQNYARHISRLHPGENSRDLRPYGQPQLPFFVTRPRPPPPPAHDRAGRDGDVSEGEAESSEDSNILEPEVQDEGGTFEELELEGDGNGREPSEVESNPAASEEEDEVDIVLEEAARDRSPLRGPGRERVSREKEIR